MQGQHPFCEEFCSLLELYVRGETTAAQMGRLYVPAGQLWTCSDMVPSLHRHDVDELVHWLHMPAWKRSGTYAAAAWHVRASIRKDRAEAA